METEATETRLSAIEAEASQLRLDVAALQKTVAQLQTQTHQPKKLKQPTPELSPFVRAATLTKVKAQKIISDADVDVDEYEEEEGDQQQQQQQQQSKSRFAQRQQTLTTTTTKKNSNSKEKEKDPKTNKRQQIIDDQLNAPNNATNTEDDEDPLEFDAPPPTHIAPGEPNPLNHRAWTDIVRVRYPNFQRVTPAMSKAARFFREQHHLPLVRLVAQTSMKANVTLAIPEYMQHRFLRYMEEMFVQPNSGVFGDRTCLVEPPNGNGHNATAGGGGGSRHHRGLHANNTKKRAAAAAPYNLPTSNYDNYDSADTHHPTASRHFTTTATNRKPRAFHYSTAASASMSHHPSHIIAPAAEPSDVSRFLDLDQKDHPIDLDQHDDLEEYGSGGGGNNASGMIGGKSILQKLMKEFKSLPKDSRVAVKKGVKLFLQHEMADQFDECIIITGDKVVTYGVPDHLVGEFTVWAIRHCICVNRAVKKMLSENNDVHLAVTHALIQDKDTVLVSVKPPASATTRAPVSIVCVVDVSGSMNSRVSVAGSESDGLTTFDVVKHAVKTIISSLDDKDFLSIVSFATTAEVDLPLTRMNDVGRKSALDVTESLHTRGSTNIWAGLDSALSQFKGVHARRQDAVNAVLLFTDGCPTDHPPNGELGMLRQRKQEHGGELPCIINTFGFGYNLDSTLLNNLAVCGNGSFAFIPDAGFVGTVFVDAACNLLASAIKSVTVQVEPLNGTQLELFYTKTLVFGHHPVSPSSHVTSEHKLNRFLNGIFKSSEKAALSPASEIALGTVQSGQPSDIILTLRNVPTAADVAILKLTVSSTVLGREPGSKPTVKTVTVVSRSSADETADRVSGQWARLYAVDTVMEAYDLAQNSQCDESVERVKVLISTLKQTWGNLADREEKRRLKELLVDLEGQVLEALQSQCFNKWGKHYLLSLLNVHRLQQCNNFKDPGVQVYQSPLFEDLRDDINEIFLKLPAPKPRRATSYSLSPSSSSARRSTAAAAPVNMSRYYNAGGGCFSGDCLIMLADNSAITVKSLRKGTRVLSQNSRHTAKVHCIVVTNLKKTPTRLIRLTKTG
ncbi:UNVERIFIED_CONTAM: hypothetical protein HDU68_008099 [Siphonaria sp. JEL0065]|nr:hypothetical protein HDU68_008099 [Siphonaria sp. JEL0065]